MVFRKKKTRRRAHHNVIHKYIRKSTPKRVRPHRSFAPAPMSNIWAASFASISKNYTQSPRAPLLISLPVTAIYYKKTAPPRQKKKADTEKNQSARAHPLSLSLSKAKEGSRAAALHKPIRARSVQKGDPPFALAVCCYVAAAAALQRGVPSAAACLCAARNAGAARLFLRHFLSLARACTHMRHASRALQP